MIFKKYLRKFSHRNSPLNLQRVGIWLGIFTIMTGWFYFDNGSSLSGVDNVTVNLYVVPGDEL